MSDRNCRTCQWFDAADGDPAYVGRCQFPLPVWLNAFLFFQVNGETARRLGRDYRGCPTWTAPAGGGGEKKTPRGR